MKLNNKTIYDYLDPKVDAKYYLGQNDLNLLQPILVEQEWGTQWDAKKQINNLIGMVILYLKNMIPLKIGRIY